MQDNSTISNYSDEEFESMILKELHRLIGVVSIKYPKEDFEVIPKLYLGFDDNDLNYYEHFFKFSQDVFVDFCEKKPKTEIEVEEFKLKWDKELENRNKFNGFEIGSPVESAIKMLTNAENITDLADSVEDDNEIMAMGSKSINGFCDGNGLSDLFRRRLLNLLRFHPVMTGRLLFEFSMSMLHKSDAINILKRHKTFYERHTGIIPCEKEFLHYLNFRQEVCLDAESLKEYLSEYMDNEVNKTYNLPKNKKYKNRKTIDITTHQTLSIETTSATVENKNLVLFQREIALIYHYENWLLTDENANNEVSKYLQKDGTRHKSGKALMADYRIVNGEFTDWLNQKVTIKYLKKIIPLLQNPKGINDAEEDLRQAIKNRESLF